MTLAAGAIIVLMVVLLLMNSVAIWPAQPLRAEVVIRDCVRHSEKMTDAQASREPAQDGGRPARSAPAPRAGASRRPQPGDRRPREPIFDVRDVDVYYGDHRAVRDVDAATCPERDHGADRPVGLRQVDVHPLPEPHERPDPARARGRRGRLPRREPLRPDIDPVQVRKRIGMVFQKPNPFPKSIYDNIAFGPRVMGMKGDMDEIVEGALRRGALWDEVKDRLKTNAFGMSGGQQQRLCIARALATEPDVLLMDEPCSALDPISTGRIEDLMLELKEDYSIVIVTHNMQQAARVSDMTAFFTVELRRARHAAGPARSSSTPRRTRSSRTRTTSARRTTSRASSAERRCAACREHRRHTSRTSSRRLEEQALGALDLVVDALDRTLEALEHRDIELAAIVIADDDRIDGRYLEVHQGILSLLALQAPVAGDLRVVAALLHVIKHAERMGDQCVNIAKLLPIVGHEPPVNHEMLETDRQMGVLARSEVAQAKQAFALRDVALARGPGAPGRARSTRSTARSSSARSTIGDDADRREWAMTMMLVARALERIGDNAVDVGEQVAFVVTGLFREFSDASTGLAVGRLSRPVRARVDARSRPTCDQLVTGSRPGPAPPHPAPMLRPR